ncbi:hypothetical protein N7465_007866 [Penicillium sp. CMV-2018d]|nr:hypothetical protein N7465_007866 [Penicillium sp. CMV-2018d]
MADPWIDILLTVKLSQPRNVGSRGGMISPTAKGPVTPPAPPRTIGDTFRSNLLQTLQDPALICPRRKHCVKDFVSSCEIMGLATQVTRYVDSGLRG